jgi:drug/metabolite transporter (DMT)-like permease
MDSSQSSSHGRAVLQALFVTFLWSTSFVLIIVGLEDIPPLTFAGLRYGLASILLAAVLLGHATARQQLRTLGLVGYGRLMALGVVFYAVTQGAQFVALHHLPAATLSLVLSFTPILVILAASSLLDERQTTQQWAGTALSVGGAVVYFWPAATATQAAVGFAAALIGLVANTTSTLLGRSVNRTGHLHPLAVTVVSMGVGSLLLVAAGVATEPTPEIPASGWLIIVWLAVVNTALAFVLWNRSLQRLTANEASIINNTMLIQVAILAWLFLDQGLAPLEIGGVSVVAVGTVLVQLRQRTTR